MTDETLFIRWVDDGCDVAYHHSSGTLVGSVIGSDGQRHYFGSLERLLRAVPKRRRARVGAGARAPGSGNAVSGLIYEPIPNDRSLLTVGTEKPIRQRKRAVKVQAIGSAVVMNGLAMSPAEARDLADRLMSCAEHAERRSS